LSGWFCAYPDNDQMDMVPVKQLFYALCQYEIDSLVTYYLVAERNRLIEIVNRNKKECLLCVSGLKIKQ